MNKIDSLARQHGVEKWVMIDALKANASDDEIEYFARNKENYLDDDNWMEAYEKLGNVFFAMRQELPAYGIQFYSGAFLDTTQHCDGG